LTPLLLGSRIIDTTGFATFRTLTVLTDIDKSDDQLDACHGQVQIHYPSRLKGVLEAAGDGVSGFA